VKTIAWKKVCCAVDYSEESHAALEVAVDLCRRTGAELTLLHVQDPAHPAGSEASAWKREAEEAGVKADATETDGDPQTAIAEWARTAGTDAIVIGTRGWTGRARSLVGSVAESTVRQAECPVMVVHPEWTGLG
jgi:nucleotide-binding universal stress UspA family protein